MADWLEVAEIVEGALFRPIDRHGNLRPRRLTDQSLALVVKRAATAAGLDPSIYAGHSLRSGLATAAAQAGVSERAIMGADRAQALAGGAPVYPPGLAVQRQCGGEGGAIETHR